MTEDQKSYRQIFKATSIFGGVQVFKIIISIIRSKVVAVLLGPSGMGIINLLVSTTGFITTLTNFGLGTSAVKNVAAATATGDNEKARLTITVLKILVKYTGILGVVLTAVFSPLLSRLTFGNNDYILAFIWISITLLLQQLSSGQLVVLQGLRKLKELAKANLYGSLFGLIISIPIYYFWKFEGIVPVIVLSSIVSMVFSWYYAGKLRIRTVNVTRKDILNEGKDMLKMGFMINLSTLISVGVSFLIQIYISNTGGVKDVGFYSAGFAIINSYVSMIFTAMYTDYYPRLAGISNDNCKAKTLINQEVEIAILILAPLIAIFLVFINVIVILLYSKEFIVITDMIQWVALGMYFKAISWSIATIFLAKGDSRLFFWNSFSQTLYTLMFSILGYKLLGLEGLGLSFLFSFFVYSVQVFVVSRMKYSFSFTKEFYKIGGTLFLIGLSCFLIMKTSSSPWQYIIGTSIIIITVIYALKELNHRIDLKSVIVNYRYKFQN